MLGNTCRGPNDLWFFHRFDDQNSAGYLGELLKKTSVIQSRSGEYPALERLKYMAEWINVFQ